MRGVTANPHAPEGRRRQTQSDRNEGWSLGVILHIVRVVPKGRKCPTVDTSRSRLWTCDHPNPSPSLSPSPNPSTNPSPNHSPNPDLGEEAQEEGQLEVGAGQVRQHGLCVLVVEGVTEGRKHRGMQDVLWVEGLGLGLGSGSVYPGSHKGDKAVSHSVRYLDTL